MQSTLDHSRQAGPEIGDRLARLVGLGLISLVLLAFTLPLGAGDRVLASWLPQAPCLFRELTGLPCPLCGMTRAFHFMGRLRIEQALECNPAGALLFLMLAVQALGGWLSLGAKLGAWRGLGGRGYWAPGVVMILASWIWRMLSLA